MKYSSLNGEAEADEVDDVDPDGEIDADGDLDCDIKEEVDDASIVEQVSDNGR